MTRFRYCRDAFFLAACTAYGINRCLIKPHAVPGFMMFHFNDLWLIPCVLPPVLWQHERLGPAHPGGSAANEGDRGASGVLVRAV